MTSMRALHTIPWALALAVMAAPAASAANALGYGAPPPVPDTAMAPGALDNNDVPHAWAYLLVDHATVVPGQTIQAAVLITLAEGWHVYWRNPGEAALPTKIAFAGDGVVGSGALLWPLPTAFLESSDILTFGYGGEVALSAPVTIAADAVGEVVLRAEVAYLACDIQCVPGQATLERRLSVGAASVLAGAERDRIARHAVTTPQPARVYGAAISASFAPHTLTPGEPFALRVDVLCPDAAACAGLTAPTTDPAQLLFWHDLGAVTLRAQRIERPPVTNGWRIEAAGNIGRFGEHPTQLDGVVKLHGPNGPMGMTFTAPFAPIAAADTAVAAVGGIGAAAASSPPANGGTSAMPLPKVLLLALLGGVILNLMPCVFPVLALKVAAFTRLVHAERGHVVAHGAAYTGGIVASLLSLAGLTVGLRSAGLAVGWGFQFQEPLFLAVLATLLVLFALNLWDVFYMSVGGGSLAAAADKQHGLKRSALEGMLAVVLATPCSAPLLGTAVGFALMADAWTIALVFATIGLGLALPFVVLTLVPGAAQLLPKPGAWMNTLKHVLSLALLGTVAWLLWLTLQLAGNEAAMRLGLFLLAAAFVAWGFGQAQRSDRLHTGAAAVVGMLVLVLGGTTLLVSEPAARSNTLTAGWQPYSDARLAATLAKGTPVFVDFTADWCITCKVNERAVLRRDDVLADFAAAGVTLMLADWTARDAEISNALGRLGRAGVPVYALYWPDRPHSPHLLPEVLTPGIIREALLR